MTRDKILQHLKEVGPATAQDISAYTATNVHTVRTAIQKLRKEKAIFINSWPYTGQHRSAQWALRTHRQANAVKPPPMTAADICREWRQRNKALLKVKRSAYAAKGNPFAMLIY